MITIKSVTRFYLVTFINESPILSKLMVTDRTQALDYFWSQPCDDEMISIESFTIVDANDHGHNYEYKLHGMTRGYRDSIKEFTNDETGDLTLEQLLDYDDSRNTINMPRHGCNTDDPYMGEPITYTDLITDIIREIDSGNVNRGIEITTKMGINNVHNHQNT